MENRPPVCNILMYSHDTYGFGHIRRSMAIANQICDYDTNVLILTGSPIAGRFPFPEQVDFVRIPGMIKKTNGDYRSLSIRIDQDQALNIRTNIILATTQTFRPHLFIDKAPHGLKREVLPTLEWLKENCPQTRSILGLRDILDDAGVICKEWQEKSVYRSLAELYDEIFIPWNEVDPLILRNKIFSLIDNREQYKKAMAAFRLSGLEIIQRRIEFFKKQHAMMSVPMGVDHMMEFPANRSPSFQEMAV